MKRPFRILAVLAAGTVITLSCAKASREGAANSPAAVIEAAVAAPTAGLTRVPPDYIRKALENPEADPAVNIAFQRVLAENSDDARKSLIRAIELKFVHDPETSTLDTLGPEKSTYYRTFAWDPADYPGGPEGPNELKADEMCDALTVVRPERRANSKNDPVVVRDEATEEVWKYMEDQWAPIPAEDRWKLNRHAVESFVKMRDQARAEGVELGIQSAHRSRATAERNAARANNPAAVASFSSHSLGLAVDFTMSQPNREFPEVTTRPMTDVILMRQSPVHKWLFLRADEFGWYPYQHEPWHWEYNPPGFRQIFWSEFPGGAPERKPAPPPAP